ncbi:hypothetical protein [Vagococcus fluvialis]|uniref:hypothetical protein n=1 Tax=Vagococcus fluvialis TaxID=2738 RepID=UPI001D0BAB01|nr:hypothetical protein [Vagococcus fluvialis]UDM72793.1 hypothetical protein K5L00_14935 [Vagococcus fluvialis]UDM78475.1 hypothetical protein K5K98_14270 [Vagococcus fluvialis]UDM84063.1 hypothetical protein K5K96_14960 [Vagococcus fluvialis]
MKKIYDDIFILGRYKKGVILEYSQDTVDDIEDARKFAANLNKTEENGEWKILKYGRPFPVK